LVPVTIGQTNRSIVPYLPRFALSRVEVSSVIEARVEDGSVTNSVGSAVDFEMVVAVGT